MAPRAQASRTGLPSSEGQGAQSGAVGTTSQSCLPRGPGAQDPTGRGFCLQLIRNREFLTDPKQYTGSLLLNAS